MKYLDALLARREAEKVAESPGGVPPKPTKPPDGPLDSPGVPRGRTAKTDETPTVPGFPFDGPPDEFSASVNPESFGPNDPPHAPRPARWRWRIAHWPHDWWVRWRRRSAELQGPNPTADQIEAADYRAFAEIHAEVTTTTS